MISIFLAIYNLAWLLAMPLIKRAPRIALGWQQRILHDCPQGPFDLWIQAASGGESQLTTMMLEELAASLPVNRRLRVLATATTKQGIDTLEKGARTICATSNIECTVAYFPFDAPSLMKKAFSRFQPKLAVLVETELWPGFLVRARQYNVPVLLVNGRMSEKSFRSYRHFRTFFHHYGPEKIYAISAVDGDRFATVFGSEKVALINNIKFDRITPDAAAPTESPVSDLLPQTAPFILLGSVRREEEDKILRALTALLAARPDCIIGLFPKHIERADQWLERLAQADIRAVKRSQAKGHQLPATVIVWDLFGELAGAYGLAAAAFVGGSLTNWGGHNFLEPLVFGLKPIIGPYWKNFAWVGREIVDSGLVLEIEDEKQLVRKLLLTLTADDNRDEVIVEVETFFKPRKGGTRQVCQPILDKLLAGERH